MLRAMIATFRLPLFRLLLLHGLAGATAAVVAVVGLVLLDVGGIGSLLARDTAPVLPFAMILAAFMLTLSSAAMGAAVMRLGASDEPGGPAGRPVRVRATMRRR